MSRKRRSTVRKPPARRRGQASSSAQLSFEFASAGIQPRGRSAPLERELLARAFERIAEEDGDELLAAAVKRLRARSMEWVPPMLEVTPKALLGRSMVRAARIRNDPCMERAGLKMMGYRVH